jgi:hypothetical protein
MEQVTVSAKALARVLTAFNGPPHYIRELQATRDIPGVEDHPIDVLIKEYNLAVDVYNEQHSSPEG